MTEQAGTTILGGDEIIDSYSLRSPRMYYGLALLILFTVVMCGMMLSFVSKNDNLSLWIASLFAAMAVYFSVNGFKRLKLNYQFYVTASHFIVKTTENETVFPLSDIAAIKMSNVGAGDGAVGSYKVVMKNKKVLWFNRTDENAEKFVQSLSRVSGIAIK